MTTPTIRGLIEQAESSIKTLEAYLSRQEVKIISPSIVVAGEDLPITERNGRVSFSEVQMTDEAFRHYCSGLQALGYDTIPLATRYVELRNRCDEIRDKE